MIYSRKVAHTALFKVPVKAKFAVDYNLYPEVVTLFSDFLCSCY